MTSSRKHRHDHYYDCFCCRLIRVMKDGGYEETGGVTPGRNPPKAHLGELQTCDEKVDAAVRPWVESSLELKERKNQGCPRS